MMKKLLITKSAILRQLSAAVLLAAAASSVDAASIRVTIKDTRCQTITGFGAACCDGAMKPFGTDTNPVKLLYGEESKVGLNIMHMEISPSFEGEGWGDYNWNGSLPSAKLAKERGALVFGTPWSPPGEYKTNGTAQGGNAEDQGYQEGRLRKDCYDKFFPWLNLFLGWMQEHGVDVDAVSVQNEPDWWVNYSGCLYTPEEQLELVKNYAYMLDREKYKGVRLISSEPLGFRPDYSDALLDDPVAREQVDIIAGHIYGHAPLGNMKTVAKKALKYGKEVWMTEHSSTDNIGERLPTWHEQLLFAEELNECMLAGCTGYIYWYMRAHWAFVSTGESKYGAENSRKNKLLPRAYVLSHFAKHVTGSTRLEMSPTMDSGTEADREFSAYIKGDSLILMAIDTTETAYDIKLKLPYKVKSGTHLLSTGNEKENLCQESPIDIEEPTASLVINMPARSLNTYIFMIDNGSTAIEEIRHTDCDKVEAYYDLQGRRMDTPHGLCIERYADGSSRKVFIKD